MTSLAGCSRRAAHASFESGAATHAGLVRERNEDSYLVAPEMGVWAVADGMGGHEAGALASSTVIAELKSIGSAVSAPDLLARFEDRVLRANARLDQIAGQQDGVLIGSTVAVVLVYETFYAAAWSGDSRIYRIRNGSIAQLSRDHTEAQDLIEKGLLSREDARSYPRRNVITRAIGVDTNPEVELEHGVLEPGDTFVLCSDGLTGHVADQEIIGAVVADEPQQACDALIALTLERGASDNVTVVVVRYRPELGQGSSTADLLDRRG
jgi:serine/threonine protein phosphatase PrpC